MIQLYLTPTIQVKVKQFAAHKRDNAGCQAANPVQMPSLSTGFRVIPGVINLSLIRHMSMAPGDCNNTGVITLQQTFRDVVREVQTMRHVEITFHACIKHLVQDRRHYQTVPLGMRHLAWKLFTTPSQEAYCETLGSLMENYHKRRYTNTGSGNDDRGLQREMFCKVRIIEIQCLVVFTTLQH